VRWKKDCRVHQCTPFYWGTILFLTREIQSLRITKKSAVSTSYLTDRYCETNEARKYYDVAVKLNNFVSVPSRETAKSRDGCVSQSAGRASIGWQSAGEAVIGYCLFPDSPREKIWKLGSNTETPESCFLKTRRRKSCHADE